MAVEAFAPAKINLTLHVTGRRADGYHLLHSLAVFADEVTDRIAVEPADDLHLSVIGPMAAGVPEDGRNIVLKAAGRLRELRGVAAGARIRLEKHLPHAAGIGGGSADAAAAIRALARLWQVAPLTCAEALPLGADVPLCLSAPRPMLMEGIGDVLSPAPPLPRFWLLLANPRVQISTANLFAALRAVDGGDNASMSPLPDRPDLDAFCDWLAAQRNDLTGPVRGLTAAVDLALARIADQPGCRASRMSGSGATVWGLWGTRAGAESARDAVARLHPDWWLRVSAIGRAG